MRRDGLQRRDHRLHMAADQIGDRPGCALVRHVDDIHAGLELEELHRQMLRAAAAGRRVVQLARLLLNQGDELAHVLRRHLRIDVDAERADGEQRDRREVLDRIERRRLERRVGGEGRRGEKKRVAIRRRLGRRLGTDVAGGAGLVVGDDRGFPAPGELRAEHARQDVGAGAGRIRHDHVHRPAGVGLLRPGEARGE